MFPPHAFSRSDRAELDRWLPLAVGFRSFVCLDDAGYALTAEQAILWTEAGTEFVILCADTPDSVLGDSSTWIIEAACQGVVLCNHDGTVRIEALASVAHALQRIETAGLAPQPEHSLAGRDDASALCGPEPLPRQRASP